MDARDIAVSDPETPELPSEDFVPARFRGVSIHEIKTVKFRCSYCGLPHTAAILPHSPQIAKYKCRQCDHVLEVETRPSVMTSIEQEFDLRLDMKNVAARGKAFSLPTQFTVK